MHMKKTKLVTTDLPKNRQEKVISAKKG